MAKVLSFLIFFLIFFSIYFLMHYYIYARIHKIYPLRYLWIIILTLSISFPLVSILERFANNTFTRALYSVGATWFGIVFFLFVGIILLDLISLTGKINYSIAGGVVLAVVLLISVYSIINAQNVQVTKVEVPIKNLPSESMKIVQLSDIHVGTINSNEFLKEIVDKTNSLNPDIVVITGDLFDGTDGLSEDMIDSLNDLNAKTYFVTGNHENYLGKEKAIKLVQETNVIVLQNEMIEVDGIQLIGISFPDNDFDRATNKLEGFKLDKDKPRILLYHLPLINPGADLQLSGHTHNGQIFPFNLLVRTSFRYVYGLYKVNDSYIYTSSGVGTWGPPMRFLANPEIVEITLTKK